MRLSSSRGPRRALSLVFIAAVVATVAACSGGAATPSPSASAAASASAGALELNGTSWLLTDYISPDGALFTVPAAVTPLLAFEGGNLTGNAGCNTFSSTYTVTGDAIELGPIMSTKMACEEPMASVEGAYLAALESIDKVAILDDGKLQLWDDGGKTTLAFLKGS